MGLYDAQPSETGLVATGTNQATGFPLTANCNHQFSTVASGTAAVLPTGGESLVRVVNMGANALAVYPPVGGSISAGSTNASVSISAGAYATFWSSTGLQWFQN